MRQRGLHAHSQSTARDPVQRPLRSATVAVRGKPTCSCIEEITEEARAIERKRVAVIDEQEIFRRGIVSSLEDDPLLEVVFQASAGSPRAAVDVAVASSQAATLERFECPVVVCAGSSEPKAWADRDDIDVLAVLQRTSVTAEELVATVRAAAIGLHVNNEQDNPEPIRALDCRRREVLRLLSEGADTHDISQSLCYSERTIKSLIQDIERRLCAQTRAQAVAEAIRHGLI